MRTAGVDLASQVGASAACVIEWPETGRARVLGLERGVTDERILELIASSERVGIDVPLGWPRPFARAVASHSQSGSWPDDYNHSRDAASFRLRATDFYVQRTTRGADHAGLLPLSVSTDRIGVPALRAAGVLGRLDHKMPLDGSGTIVEAYPAGALARWGLPYRQYKGAGEAQRQRRHELVAALREATSGYLTISRAQLSACQDSDDVLDALVAACIARAVAIGEVRPIPRDLRKLARREGWIAVPRRGALRRLGSGTPVRSATAPSATPTSAALAPPAPIVPLSPTPSTSAAAPPAAPPAAPSTGPDAPGATPLASIHPHAPWTRPEPAPGDGLDPQEPDE